jgi:hypothetical protein
MAHIAAGGILAADLAGRLPLAQNNFGDTEAGGVAGPLGLVIIVLLAVATVLLIRNMNRRLRRLPDSFSAQEQASGGLPLSEVSRQDHSHQHHPDGDEGLGGETAQRGSGSQKP